MQKWEYVTAEDSNDTELNAMGQLGWELCFVGNRVVYKRPIEPNLLDYLKAEAESNAKGDLDHPYINVHGNGQYLHFTGVDIGVTLTGGGEMVNSLRRWLAAVIAKETKGLENV